MFKKNKKVLHAIVLVTVLCIVRIQSFSNDPIATAETPGVDPEELSVMHIFNEHRAHVGCLEPLTYATELQQGVEHQAVIAELPESQYHRNVPEIFAYVTDYQPYDEGAQESFDSFWNTPSGWQHLEYIENCSYKRVALAHVMRQFPPPYSENPAWFWVAEFSTESNTRLAPPKPILDSNIVVSANPITPGERQFFTFTVKNGWKAEQDLIIDDIFVRVWKPDGSAWENPRWANTNVVIPRGQSYEFRLDAEVPNQIGTWTVHNIEIHDRNHGWMNIDQNGFSYLSFEVTPPHDGKAKIVAGRKNAVLNHEWTRIVYKDGFGGDVVLEGHNPLLVANLCSSRGPDFGYVQIRNVDSYGFDARVKEDVNYDGNHWTTEDVCYFAIAKSASGLPYRGSITFNQSDPDTWTNVPYGSSYGGMKTMAASIVTHRGPDDIHLDISASENDTALKLEESPTGDGKHFTDEDIHWIVWTNRPEGMRTGAIGNVTHEWSTRSFNEWFTKEPVVIAVISTENGDDCALPEIKHVTKDSFQVRVYECYPLNGKHFAGERIDWMAVEPGVLEW